MCSSLLFGLLIIGSQQVLSYYMSLKPLIFFWNNIYNYIVEAPTALNSKFALYTSIFMNSSISLFYILLQWFFCLHIFLPSYIVKQIVSAVYTTNALAAQFCAFSLNFYLFSCFHNIHFISVSCLNFLFNFSFNMIFPPYCK